MQGSQHASLNMTMSLFKSCLPWSYHEMVKSVSLQIILAFYNNTDRNSTLLSRNNGFDTVLDKLVLGSHLGTGCNQEQFFKGPVGMWNDSLLWICTLNSLTWPDLIISDLATLTTEQKTATHFPTNGISLGESLEQLTTCFSKHLLA